MGRQRIAPVAVAEIDAEQRFADAEVSGRADREEFGEAFDDAKEEGEEIVVQTRPC
jgi:hypothetical protein